MLKNNALYKIEKTDVIEDEVRRLKYDVELKTLGNILVLGAIALLIVKLLT